ncbi:hypothetical protein [Streptomyces rimosus]|uniref:hypothetical protein n=1 Tax=Streptomyces rimosus TaxID=1927 RepID=UPI0037CF80A3
MSRSAATEQCRRFASSLRQWSGFLMSSHTKVTFPPSARRWAIRSSMASIGSPALVRVPSWSAHQPFFQAVASISTALAPCRSAVSTPSAVSTRWAMA